MYHKYIQIITLILQQKKVLLCSFLVDLFGLVSFASFFTIPASPYLREDIETDGSAEVNMNVIACSQGDHSVTQVTGSVINTQQVRIPQA